MPRHECFTSTSLNKLPWPCTGIAVSKQELLSDLRACAGSATCNLVNLMAERSVEMPVVHGAPLDSPFPSSLRPSRHSCQGSWQPFLQREARRRPRCCLDGGIFGAQVVLPGDPVRSRRGFVGWAWGGFGGSSFAIRGCVSTWRRPGPRTQRGRRFYTVDS